jgi:hypothetical protein
LRLSEKAKKTLTIKDRYVEELYDPDLGTSISFIINSVEFRDLLQNSHIPTALNTFISQCKQLISESGCTSITNTAFIGGTFMQPVFYSIVIDSLAEADLPCPRDSKLGVSEAFYAVASGAISLSDVKIEGLCLLNSIFLRTGKKQEVNFKLLFRKGDPYPAASKDFALGKVDENQTHFKFWLAELDSFQDVGCGASYRPITYNGKFYRMRLPSDARAGDFRFITRFHIDDDLKISVSMYDEESGVNLYSRQEIGNRRSDISYIDVPSSDQFIEQADSEGGTQLSSGRERLFLSDESSTENNQSMIPAIGTKISETEILFSRPSTAFEAQVEQEIVDWSFPGWIITGSTIPGSQWKPDHLLVLKNGVFFVIEDKDYSGKWVGAENGPWRCDDKKIMCGTTKGVEDDNPLREVEKSFYAALKRVKQFGTGEPFGVATVLAPSFADLTGIDIAKKGKLVKLHELCELIKWAVTRQDQMIEEGKIDKPYLTREIVCKAFGIHC